MLVSCVIVLLEDDVLFVYIFFSDIVSICMGNGFVFSSVPEVKTELHLFASIRLRMVKPKTNAQLSSTTYGND